jgi:hypothetical protein
LSGRASVSIVANQLASVFTFACQKAVSLNSHLFLLASHPFTFSHAHHFSQSEVSFTSSFSIKFLIDQ